MDWLAFMEKKKTELLNTGCVMEDETFITHLLNSLPQVEYEGAILVIKEKLRKENVDLPEIEQILEDKYQSMKHVKGWDNEEDDYALFTSHTSKKKYKNNSKEDVHTVESMDTKQWIAPTRKAFRIEVSSGNLVRKRCTVLKESTKERDMKICPEISDIIVENMTIMHMTVQNHVIMPILLEKMSETKNSQI